VFIQSNKLSQENGVNSSKMNELVGVFPVNVLKLVKKAISSSDFPDLLAL
jgi:hypothetical protein